MPIRAAKLQQTIGMTNIFLRVFLKYFLTTLLCLHARVYIIYIIRSNICAVKSEHNPLVLPRLSYIPHFLKTIAIKHFAVSGIFAHKSFDKPLLLLI